VNFTFGISTTYGNETFLKKTIESILSLNIENYEIVIVGGSNKILIDFPKSNLKHLKFDESLKEKWITRKKNLIIEEARFENIVFMHDYILLDKDWYHGFEKFGNSFTVCTNKILNYDSTRYRDWALSPNNYFKIDSLLNNSLSYLLPYDENSLTKYMYISGAYWVAKKYFMENNKLNENLIWGQGEDVEWSHRVRKKIKFEFNNYSTIKLQKQKDIYFKEIPDKILEQFKNRSIIEKFIDQLLVPYRRFKKKGKFFKYF